MNLIDHPWWWGWRGDSGNRPRLRHLYIDCTGIVNHQRVRPGARPARGSGKIDLDAPNTCRLCARRWNARGGGP